MATGIPKKKKKPANKIYLVYDGKKATHKIITGAIKPFRPVYSFPSKNTLYFGDNLDVLRLLLSDPEVCGKVDLIYIDPPFATQSKFISRRQSKAYEDVLTGAEYVEFLRERLILLHKLLSDTGSIYVHLDENMVFEIKIIMDEIFGSSNYRNIIIRKKCNPKNYTRKVYGNIADFILFYTKSSKYTWNKPTVPLSEESKKEYRYIEEGTGRRYMKVPLHAPGIRNGETGKPWRGIMPPPGKHWQYPPAKLDEMDARGEIYWSKNGNPRRKVYLDEHPGVGVQDIWLEFPDAHNQNIKITGYPTEKNPDLIRRIIAASSNPGDLVLDCFVGSGTTLAVANEMQRNWIGIDNSVEAIKTILDRFKNGLKPMGDYVTKQNRAGSKYQRSLFESLKPSAHNCTSTQLNHNPIINFSIFIPANSNSQIEYIINEWKQSINDFTAKSPW
jgi:adenine-specific DNA-methyltransferase